MYTKCLFFQMNVGCINKNRGMWWVGDEKSAQELSKAKAGSNFL